MAYLIFTTARGRELGRRPLEGPMVIGRSRDCEVCVHDILLSRRHCQIEPAGPNWVVSDLMSKNGTFLNGQEIGRHMLGDGEALRMGKTIVTFCAGTLEVRGGAAMNRPNPFRQRPADPFESAAATVSGFDYAKSLAQRNERLGSKPRIVIPPQAPVADASSAGLGASFPRPQPMPRDPKAYQSDDIYALITELASSSWDSIYMNASRPAPTRVAPTPIVAGVRHPRQRGGALVDLSLQVRLRNEAWKPPPKRRPSRWKRALWAAARGVAAIGQSALLLGIAHLLGKN
jgi:hypothetical protein